MNLKDLLNATELIKEEVQKLGQKNELLEKDYELLEKEVHYLMNIVNCYTMNSLKSCTASGLAEANRRKMRFLEFLQGPDCSAELIQKELKILIENNLMDVNFMIDADEE